MDATASVDSPRARSPNAMLRSTVRCGNSAKDWKTIATPRLAGASRDTSSPSISTCPPSISSSPAIARSSVDFPEPGGAEDRHELPRLDGQGELPQCLDAAVADREPFDAQNLPSVSSARRSKPSSRLMRP